MADHQAERRKTRRVEASLNLQVKLPLPDGTEEATSLQTLNISSSGVYFRSDHFIEPMTKLEMELQLTVPSSTGAAEPDLASLLCEGIVVRVTPEAPADDSGPFEVAVFFTHIEPDGLSALENHIAMVIA